MPAFLALSPTTGTAAAPGTIGAPGGTGGAASDPASIATPSALLATATGTQVLFLTVTATQTALPTVTVMPTPTPVPLALVSIQPATVLNNQPARIAIIGGGFVDTDYKVTVGGRLLRDVHVESGNALTGTLPAGLCSGAYAATLQDNAGHEVSGGRLTIQSVRTIVQGESPTALSVPLTGWTQRRTVALPSVSVEDSECGQSDWRLLLTVEMPRDNTHGKTLIPGIITVRWTDGGTAKVKLSPPDGQDREQGILEIPRNGATAVFLTPSLELELPANAFAGSYTTALSVSFAD